MSLLTEALKRILHWKYQQYCFYISNLKKKQSNSSLDIEESFFKFNPGLSIQEIRNITKDLPFQLPPEICELYQWRNGLINGLDCFFDVGRGWPSVTWCGFKSLQAVVNQAMTVLERKSYMAEELGKWGIIPDTWSWQSGLWIFPGDECRDGSVVINKNDLSSLVIFVDYKGGGNTVIAKYASLTSMMLTMADCYEQAFYRDDRGYLSCDEEKARKIWQQYNSERIVERTLKRVEKIESSLPEMNPNTGYEFLQEVGDVLKFSQDSRLIDLLIRVITRPPLNTTYDENLNYLRSMALMFLDSGGIDAVESLILALKHESWQTQYWAAYVLGYLNNTRAVDPLIETLQDSNSEVREMAREALNRLLIAFPEIEDKLSF